MELQTVPFEDALSRRMLDQRRVMLTGMIDGKLAERACAQLLVLESEDAAAPVTLYLHSPGGEVDAGFAIYDTMQALQCDVATVCLGFAASMAQFLLVGGAPGKRAAYAHSRILMHQGSAGIGGSAVEVELQAADLRQTRDTVLGIIAEDTGQAVERIFEDSTHDHWYSADEARYYGFVDAIADSFSQVMPSKKRPFGLRTGNGS